jgi:hypothetical protein
MTKITLTFETSMSKEEIQKLLAESSIDILEGKLVKFKVIPHMVKLSILFKSKHDTMRIQ